MQKYPALVALTCMLCFACNPTRVVQPIPKGQLQVGANFGGPMILLNSTPLPLPLTSICANYGFRDHTTGFASLHTTSLLFGVLQTDFGITRQLLKPQKFIPGLSVSPIANMLFDRWERQYRFYPQLDVNAYWNYGTKKKLAYISLNNWFELRKTRAHEEPQTVHWIPSIGLGHQWQHKRYTIQAEIKYIAPMESNSRLVVDYISMSSKGVLGLYIGINRKF